MDDLHAVLTARIEALENLAQMAGRDSNSERWVPGMFRIGLPEMAEHIATWDPATVLRGLAEDRDILRRHRHYTKANGQVTQLFCAGCDDGDAWITNGVGCEWLLSVARRLNVEVS